MGVEVGGGEERVEAPGVEQGALIGGLDVEVGDAAHDQPPRYLLAVLTGGDREVNAVK